MNDVVFRPPRQPRITLPNAAEQKPASRLPRDPAIILIGALGISLAMLVVVIGWLLLQS